MSTRDLGALACAIGGLLGLVSCLQAQEARPRGGLVLEEVIVTAQKRTENLQNVPVAVTALSGEQRDLTGITTIEDMTNVVPGFTYDTQFDRANIRGIGRVTNAAGSDPAVALYVDGFYVSSTKQAGRSTLFNERVEVLRGPQGTLYGRNATGGAVNTISRRPNKEFGSEFRAAYGEYDRQVVEGTVTGPITAWLGYRVSAAMTKQLGGYFDNIGPGRDEGGTADDRDYDLVLAAELSDDVDLDFRYSFREEDRLDRFSASFAPYAKDLTCVPICSVTSTPFGSTLLSAAFSFNTFGSSRPNELYNSGTGLLPADPQYPVENPATPDNNRQFNANVPTRRKLDDSHGFVSHLTWRLPAFDVKWTGGYTQYEYYSLSDSDNSGRQSYVYTPPATVGGLANPGNAFPVTVVTGSHLFFFEDKSYWSNELNFTSSGAGPLQWLAGLYQYHEDYFQIPIAGQTRNPGQSEIRTVYARPSALPTGSSAVATYDSWTTLAEPNPDGAYSNARTNVVANSYAAFTQFDWQFAEHWKTSIGVRYSIDQKEGWESRRNIIWDPTYAGSRAKAFDNSPPRNCYSPNGQSLPDDPNLQAVYDAASGALVPITQCRYRSFDKREWQDYSGTAGLQWQPNDAVLTYLKYSRGYKSGAIRLGSFNPDSEVDPEYINAYELGAKLDATDRWQVNTSAFYYANKDYQFPLSYRDENNTLRTEYANLPKVGSYGLEAEATWLALDDLTMLLSYGYLHTEQKSDVYVLDNFDRQAKGPEASPDVILVPNATQPGGFDYYQNTKGSRLPGSPEQKVSGTLSYNWHFAPGTLTALGTYSWRDKMSNSTGLLERSTTSTKAYDTTDVRFTWVDADGRYTIIGFVRNVFDDDTYNTATARTVGSDVVIEYNLNPPRTWGLEMQYRFGSEVR